MARVIKFAFETWKRKLPPNVRMHFMEMVRTSVWQVTVASKVVRATRFGIRMMRPSKSLEINQLNFVIVVQVLGYS